MKLIPISGEDLEGKLLLVKKSALKPEYHHDRRFKAKGGFGCKPYLMGRAVIGTFLVDGENARMDRHDFEGIIIEE